LTIQKATELEYHMAIKLFLYETYKIKLKGFFDIIIKVYLIMSYQPTPFSLIMPEVPAHMSDGDIARLWGEPLLHHCGHSMINYIRCIQLEPVVDKSKRCQRVTIHFDDFPRADIRQQIDNGYYETNIFKFPAGVQDYLINRSYLLPCDRPQPPRTDYSHVVALQLQDVVKKQADHIHRLEAQLIEIETNNNRGLCHQAEQMERLENRIKEMETTIREGTEIQLDIQQTYTATFERLESRLLEQDSYRIRLEANMKSLQELHFEDMKQHIEEKEELKQKIEALTEWCSQPVWKRTTSFVLPKEPEDRFVSEF